MGYEIPKELKKKIEEAGYNLDEVVIFETGLWMTKKDYEYSTKRLKGESNEKQALVGRM